MTHFKKLLKLALFLTLLTGFAQAQTLMKADHLEARIQASDAVQTKSFLEFRQLVDSKNLSTLRKLAKGSPAARLYGAIGLAELRPEEGRKRLEALKSDKSPLSFSEGCIIEATTVGEMAASLLANSPDSQDVGKFR